jgi:hypothetical protein
MPRNCCATADDGDTSSNDCNVFHDDDDDNDDNDNDYDDAVTGLRRWIDDYSASND